MKPNRCNRLIRASLITSLVVTAHSSSAIAGDVFWLGSTDNDWNTADNWDAGRVPVKTGFSDNAIINTLTNFPEITADLAEIPNEIKIGTGGGNTGRVDQSAGSAAVGAGGWSAVGEFGGNGTYNLADTSASGGALTGFGAGSGSFTTQRLYVSREGTGGMSVNTSGEVKVFNDMYVGNGGTGTLKWDAGTLNRNGDGGWMVIGNDGGGQDGNGTFDISGGTINAANDTIVGLNAGSTGNLNQSGGTYNAGGMWIGRDGGTGAWTVTGADTVLNSSGEVYVGGNSNSTGSLQISSGTVALNNWVNVGRDGGDGTLEMTGGAMTVERALRIGFGRDGFGTLALSGGAQINAATLGEVIVIGGDKGSGIATVTGTGTLLRSTGEFYVGNDDESIGELTVSGGTVESGSWFGIGRNGAAGTLTINGTGVVNQGTTDLGSRLQMTNNGKPSTATIHLDGGTLITNGIENDANGTTHVFLNGGLLKARVNSLNFLQGMSGVTVRNGGAKIDTNGVSITINQSMIGEGDDGGLTKTGDGTLRLNGTNAFVGTTTITNGTLAGTGSLAGPLVVQSDAAIAPGPPSSGIGTFSAGNTSISGVYSCGVNGAGSDSIQVDGLLDLSSADDVLDFSLPGAGATLPVYVIATYTTLSGTFDEVVDLPPGYSVVYGYNGENKIVLARTLTPYESWIATYLPGETDPAVIGMEADPDGDGESNQLEFALGGAPGHAGDNARIHVFTEDGSDPGIAKELLMTIAVRAGEGAGPVFSPLAGGNPTATQDGVTYTIQGGADFEFTGTVSVVDPVTTGLAAPPAGYVYRTFRLDGSDGLPGRGFLRVVVGP